MKALTPRDAAIIALVVENPRMGEPRYQGLRSRAENGETQELLDAIRAHERGEPLTGATMRFTEAMSQIDAWCAANEGRRALTPEGVVYILP